MKKILLSLTGLLTTLSLQAHSGNYSSMVFSIAFVPIFLFIASEYIILLWKLPKISEAHLFITTLAMNIILLIPSNIIFWIGTLEYIIKGHKQIVPLLIVFLLSLLNCAISMILFYPIALFFLEKSSAQKLWLYLLPFNIIMSFIIVLIIAIPHY